MISLILIIDKYINNKIDDIEIPSTNIDYRKAHMFQDNECKDE